MLGIIYFLVSIVFGVSLVELIVDTKSIYQAIGGRYSAHKVLKSLFVIPTGIITGIMSITFVNYYIIYFLCKIREDTYHNYPLGVFLTFVIFIALSFFQIKKIRARGINKQQYPKKTLIFYAAVSLLLIIVPTFLMFYSYRINGEKQLIVGPTVFSDLSPHTAMVSSFGVGGNIPTEYMHFPGDGIKWHFFFYFYCGMLRYLNIPIDFALNVPSILVMSTALVLVGLLATLISKNRLAYLMAPLLVLFRSALNIFDVIKKYQEENMPVIKSLLERHEWTDTTPYDGWGLWSINVYPNQRHLMLGVSVLLILIMIFLPFVKEMLKSLRRVNWKEKIKQFVFSKDAWIEKPKNKNIIIAFMLSIMLPYFHGSALITCLLVLCILAIFSKNRLTYLLLAVLSIISSFIQTNIFSSGAKNVVNFQWKLGFVVGNVTIMEVLKYIWLITGVALFIALFYSMTRRKDRLPMIAFFSFVVPFIFTFLFQVTTEMTANHKFIQFSIILMDVFIAGFVSDLLIGKNLFFRKKAVGKKKIAVRVCKLFVGVICLVLLTSTGIMEWIIFINMNKGKLVINTKSPLVTWIKKNTEKEDVFLTPMWALDRFFLAGRPCYFGWPYYAWSAGHDTEKRGKEYEDLLRGFYGDKQKFVDYCKEHHIKYIVDNPEMFDTAGEDVKYNATFIRETFKLVAEFEEENTRIYQVY